MHILTLPRDKVGSGLVPERAFVLAVQPDGTVDVELAGGEVITGCEVLNSSEDSPLRLIHKDAVLLLLPYGDAGRGIILGRLGSSRTRTTEQAEPGNSAVSATPDTLVLEAKRELTLRVGEGSITIRQDGKILLRGKDLVSHAQRMNRIKGGSVSIN
jgi:hypothetical protein